MNRNTIAAGARILGVSYRTGGRRAPSRATVNDFSIVHSAVALRLVNKYGIHLVRCVLLKRIIGRL